jgi:hypothetical protein
MRNKPSKKESWRDEIVASGDFKCACGCGLRLSRGDLADAMRLMSVFGAAGPRTYGVTFTNFADNTKTKREAEEPTERQLCPGCRFAVVEIPPFAAQLLRDRDAKWPKCLKCKTSAE